MAPWLRIRNYHDYPVGIKIRQDPKDPIPESRKQLPNAAAHNNQAHGYISDIEPEHQKLLCYAAQHKTKENRAILAVNEVMGATSQIS